MYVSEELAEWVLSVDSSALGAGIMSQMRLSLLDTLGCIVMGSHGDSAAPLRSYMGNNFGPPDATIVANIAKGGITQAAYLNATYASATELADAYPKATVHAGAAVVPATLAVAELVNASGEDVLVAIAAGYEALIRLALSIGTVGTAHSVSYDQGWFPPGLCGAFGAAASAAKLLDLSPAQLAHAFGIAATLSPAASMGALLEGATVKNLYLGGASSCGVAAARLASEGITGVLDLERYWMPVVAPAHDASVVTADLGTRFELMDGMIFKFHACVGPLFGAIEAALRVRRLPVEAAAIDNVLVETYARGTIMTNPEPRTPTGAKGSIPYCVAYALIHGDLADAFCDESLVNPETQALARRVKVIESAEFEAVWPSQNAARVSVGMQSGDTHVGEVWNVPGWYMTPTEGELKAKFLSVVAPVVGQALATQAMAEVLDIGTAESVNSLMTTLRIDVDSRPDDAAW
jgi:2-methylcitrate dehydratase PrpD